MKKLFLLFVLAFLTSFVFSQTLFTYGRYSVSKDEFLRAYNKNKTVVTDKNKALRDYLELYIRFKLKVKAANQMHLDTLASLATDLQNFRAQIEDGYLNDEKQVNALVQEAFDRSQKDIHVEYVFIPQNKTSDDSAKSFAAAQMAYHDLKSVAPETEAKILQTKEVGATWADAGFITVFSLPYIFENIVYDLKPGEASVPFRAKNGYYIFKNIEERKAAGKMKAAQILIAIPDGAGEEEKANAKKLSDSLYSLIQKGADFGELAKKYSDDKMTYMTGGIIPEFGTGKYEPLFENKVFSLQKDGDVTPPFKTQYGYHIVKRISRTPVISQQNDAGYNYILKQQVQQDERISSAKEKFTSDVLKKLNYKKNTLVNEKQLWNVTDTFLITGKEKWTPLINDKTILFSINNRSIKVTEWLKFIKDYRNSGMYKEESDKDLMNKFVASVALEDYRKKLEDYNQDFKYQLQEFKDGNMLFEIMERNVWTKASADTVGLREYYNQNKTKYLWGESADAVLISASNEKVAKEAADKIRNGKAWQEVLLDNSAQMQSDSARYELSQIPLRPKTKIVEGIVTEPLVNETDGTATFVKILKIYPSNQQRSFEEARGLVINDYQNYLEEKWIQSLKKEYPVKVDEKVFSSITN